MTGKPYILLDAGGVLLFPNPKVLAEIAGAFGGKTDVSAFYEGHYRAVHAYDRLARDTDGLPAITAQQYFMALFGRADVEEARRRDAVGELMVRDAEDSIWCFSHAWVAPALESLQKTGYRMSVVSNSDGRVKSQLEAVGLAEYFEHIFDSGIVGIEKPDPAFFQHALLELNLAPDAAVYCGDIFHVDVVGANRAGIGAMQVDPFGLYRDWPGMRLQDIRALEGQLKAGLPEAVLFPTLG
jgi:putative hydrolase of the HAD superfamily